MKKFSVFVLAALLTLSAWTAKAEVVVPKLSSWSWLLPASDPATTDADFDTTWYLPTASFGTYNGPAFSAPQPGILGYGDAFQNTSIGPIPPTGANPATDPGSRFSAYFRSDFTTATPSNNLLLSALIDDGAVVYLDGAEIGRQRVAAATPDTWGLQATGGPAVESAYESVPLTISTIPAGNHTLAVSVHNLSTPPGNSSDLSFDLGLDRAIVPPTPIQVASPPGTTEPFNGTTAPIGVQWSGGQLAGAGTTVGDVAGMLAPVQTVAVPTTQLAAITTNPPTGNAALPQFNSATGNVQTSPTGNAANYVTAHLQNASGAAVSKVHVTYDLGLVNPATTINEQVPGHEIYYSLTGAANSWTFADNFGFNGGAGVVSPQSHAFDINLGNWGVGADLYVLWADDNADGVGDAIYTLDNVNFLPTLIGGGGAVDPIKVVVAPANGSTVNNNGTVQVTNQVVGINATQDPATVSGVSATGAGFTQSGLSNGTIAAGSNQTGTVAFAKTATMLNGPAYGKLDFAVASGPNGAGTGSGSYSYVLKGTVSGNTGNGSSVIPAGQSYAGLSGNTVAGGALIGSTATILGGANTTAADRTVAMNWRARAAGTETFPGAHPLLPAFASALTSDVVNLTGTDGTLFALQMTYNPAILQQPAAADQAIGHLFLASLNTANNTWVNAVTLNHGVNTTNAAFLNVNSSYANFLAANGGTLSASMLGAWGVDLAANSVWAVLDHNSEFASVPEPSSILLGSLGLVGLVFGAIRRRRMA